MSSILMLCGVVVFIVTILFTARYFYLVNLRAFTRKKSKQLGLDILEAAYSFDQMVYVVSLPSSIKEIRDVTREDIVIEYEYTSYFFPRLLGIEVYIKTEDQHITIAYLPIAGFRLPKLDRLVEQGKLNEVDYAKISTYKLIHETTLKEIAEEVYRQLTTN